MSHKLFHTLLFFLFLNSAKAGVGDPTIQAVCKITLNNGKIIEGFITLGYGSYDGIWMNGFYLESYQNNKYKYQNTEFFTLSFKSFTRIDSSYKFTGSNYHNCRRIKFLQWANGPSYQPERGRLVYNDTVPYDTLKIISKIERNYLVLDSINIYFRIPSDTYLETFSDTGTENRFNKVAINDIADFELLVKPQIKWLNMIALAKHTFEGLNSGEESTGDFIQASWYHELLISRDKYEQLQNVIIRNIER